MVLSDLTEKLNALHQYSACDISDALLKIETVREGERPLAGFLADIVPIAPYLNKSDASQQSKIIAPASTVLFQPKLSTSIDSAPPISESNIPKRCHWVDLTKPNTVVILDQPQGQHCAVMGGIMGARMKYLGASAVLVTGGGRVRDVTELNSLGLPVWARATSTVGTNAEAKPYAIDIPLCVGGLIIRPGDIMFCDPAEGVVAIPQDLVDSVLEILPRLVEADDRVKKDVKNGISVQEAFAKHRTGL